MGERVVMASRFKAQCLALLEQVASTGVPILVTKRGKPIARLVPLDEPDRRPTMGTVTLLADDDESYYTTGEDLEADRSA